MLAGSTRPERGATESPAGIVVATIYHLERRTESRFAEFFHKTIAPILTNGGVPIVAAFITEHHPNTFPALPVRADANVFIWFSRFADRAAYDGMPDIRPTIANRISGQPEVLFLAPTARSLLRA
jgi:hypothetical protein